MKKFKVENYQVGYFLTKDSRDKLSSHVIEIGKNNPVYGFHKNETSSFIFKSFNIEDATCHNCKRTVEGLKRREWKRY